MDRTIQTSMGPWHEGEIEVQERAGVRQEADELSGMYRRQIPAAMAGFLSQQQFAVLSTEDVRGRVWANLIAGNPGMIDIRSPNQIALVHQKIETSLPIPHIQSNSRVGLIVIDFSRRIRVRINGNAHVEGDGSIAITIEQFYGNCSQYIQKRVVNESTADKPSANSAVSSTLSTSQRDLIEHADTFFVASRHPTHGADASHRGGKPGFVQATAPDRISFPDYSGNNMFNTLGNIAVHPAVGLLFVDFELGRSLQVSGRASVDWSRDWSRDRSSTFDKAQRVVDVQVEEVRETEHATSLRYRFIGYSPTLE